MQHTVYWIRLLHILAVATYVGTAIFFDFILGPALRFIPPGQATIVTQRVSRVFTYLAWACWAVILATGLARLYVAGSLSPSLLHYRYGWWILAKIILLALLVINGLLVSFWLRPQIEVRLDPSAPAEILTTTQERVLRAAERLNRITHVNVALALLALMVGASLAYGGLF